MVLFLQRSGPCPALRWGMYRCGAISDPKGVVLALLPQWLRFAAPILASMLSRLAPRWVAAGVGCDSSLVYSGSPKMGPLPNKEKNHD
jgi:hypothetical protein